MNQFDEDYYERGVEKHKSGYTNYHYMPERSYSEAIEIVKKFADCETVLDFGCAKGFLVHTLQKLGKYTAGEDISEYAIENCLPSVRDRVFHLNKEDIDDTLVQIKYDLVIAKDILEHVPENEMLKTMDYLAARTNKYLFAGIRLGDNDLFRIREFEVDVTHVTKKDEDWWIESFQEAGFKLKEFAYSMGAIKEKWTKQFPYGNGFFILEPQ